MRVLAAAIALAIGFASGPAKADMADAFGNTIVSHYPDGGWVKHFFERDGRYSALFSDGRRLTAQWQVEGSRVCLNGLRPRIMMISRYCSALVEADVGETWQSRDPLGRNVRNELLAGRR
ncbi:MAG: hypothetical protein EON87_18870 [Brevundimonas sp.]|nr:MAG: hypothetical protein EON87_18870 [Brevundimonas sp.]